MTKNVTFYLTKLQHEIKESHFFINSRGKMIMQFRSHYTSLSLYGNIHLFSLNYGFLVCFLSLFSTFEGLQVRESYTHRYSKELVQLFSMQVDQCLHASLSCNQYSKVNG